MRGFDIAGAEDGYPPSRFAEAFDYLKRHSFEFTIHAGEAFGCASIWEAVQLCGASRLGHGVRLADDIAPDGTLGELAGYVRDRRMPPELCPSSNLNRPGMSGDSKPREGWRSWSARSEDLRPPIPWLNFHRR